MAHNHVSHVGLAAIGCWEIKEEHMINATFGAMNFNDPHNPYIELIPINPNEDMIINITSNNHVEQSLIIHPEDFNSTNIDVNVWTHSMSLIN